MRQKRFPVLMWLGLLCVGVLLTACTAVTPVAPAAEATAAPDATSAPQLANPASVNCTEQGGTLTIETRGDGGEFGVCILRTIFNAKSGRCSGASVPLAD